MIDDDDGRTGQAGALQAILEAANDSALRSEYPLASGVMNSADLQGLIELAWRHQFNDDRTKFKREVRGLQVHVSAKLIAKLQEEK